MKKETQWAVTEEEGALVLAFPARSRLLDADCAELAEEFKALLSETGASRVVLDLSAGPEYASAMFIGLLVRLVKAAKDQGRASVCCARPILAETLEVHRLESLLGLRRTRAEALAAFRQDAS
ncbi:MAG: STAS domain-containing protein [Gemmataceae bacterium]|nr:STAS domain-containing protein [Gemmataceae bacterium]